MCVRVVRLVARDGALLLVEIDLNDEEIGAPIAAAAVHRLAVVAHDVKPRAAHGVALAVDGAHRALVLVGHAGLGQANVDVAVAVAGHKWLHAPRHPRLRVREHRPALAEHKEAAVGDVRVLAEAKVEEKVTPSVGLNCAAAWLMPSTSPCFASVSLWVYLGTWPIIVWYATLVLSFASKL